MKTLNLTISKTEFNIPIHIGENIAPSLHDLLTSSLTITGARKFLIITDSNLAKLYLPQFLYNDSNSNWQIEHYILPAGEASKNLEQLEQILNLCNQYKLTRKDYIVSFGGGMVSDIAGLAASLYMRGINFIAIPTSLIAQCDAAIGGKTAINLATKNQIGSFYQPKAIICDLSFLKTLPSRQLKSAFSEIIKYGLINDAQFFEHFFEQCETSLRYFNSETPLTPLQNIIEASIAHKIEIITADPFDQKQRKLLNLGHSFAHALEAATGYDSTLLLHGEAVGIGLVLAFEFSNFLGICPASCSKRIAELLQKLELPYSLNLPIFSHLTSQAMLELMLQDKKNSPNSLNLILARDIGNIFEQKNINHEQLIKFLEKKLDK